ncbi:MAG: histidine phosphatase family protein [Thiobacillaceae bacterium]
MELILWRHADAEDSSPDMARILTQKGRTQAARMADWLNPRLPPEVRVLMSPAMRTMQTAQALGRECEVAAALAPGASADAVIDAAGWPGGEGCVVVVGHQPTLGRIATRLLTGRDGDIGFRKGGIWWFQNRIRQGEVQVVLKVAVSPDWL